MSIVKILMYIWVVLCVMMVFIAITKIAEAGAGGDFLIGLIGYLFFRMLPEELL